MEAKTTSTRTSGAETVQLDFSYRKISYDLRKQLIQLVINEGSSVYRASRILKINNSTAKAIIRKFRKDGTIYIRKRQIQSLCCQSPLRIQTENQEQQYQASLQQQCSPGVFQEHYETPLFYFYNLGVENCYGFPTYSFATFY